MSTEDDSTAQGAPSASDETKRKFREALDKKNDQAKKASGEAHLDGHSAVTHTHGNADTRQEFRRKSG
ncbi:DUF5302 domain-containing protein [Leifsonia sp. YIM 134122]|uniref:DUF5302 domain-containing protein n=2 Tax=Microbacteriaceae TaxID=85023 RepID=A0A4Y9R203_9MICO|nr:MULTISPECIES: DUF5302 domain-containing protein [Leifsonia]KQQ95621.1 hypothetical protein ASF62_03730 [Leifsonia sp. Leaf325]TFV98724.1 hypothetical protein E4M00_04175 [Leifsonia flava]